MCTGVDQLIVILVVVNLDVPALDHHSRIHQEIQLAQEAGRALG